MLELGFKYWNFLSIAKSMRLHAEQILEGAPKCSGIEIQVERFKALYTLMIYELLLISKSNKFFIQPQRQQHPIGPEASVNNSAYESPSKLKYSISIHHLKE